MTDNNSTAGDRSAKPEAGWRATLVPVVALMVLIGFAGFVVYLLINLKDASELVWTRAMYLLSGVEAIAFAAAGYFFGSEVHRVQANKAEARADRAEKDAIEAERFATEASVRGQTLVTLIEAKAAAVSSGEAAAPPFADDDIIPESASPRSPSVGRAVGSEDILELARVARELYR